MINNEFRDILQAEIKAIEERLVFATERLKNAGRNYDPEIHSQLITDIKILVTIKTNLKTCLESYMKWGRDD